MVPLEGRMAWPKALAGPLAGATCLWQDLDGLRVEAPPAASPPISIMWAWRTNGLLVWLRLDGQTAYVAVHEATTQALLPTVPWDLSDGRVLGSVGRGPDGSPGGVGTRYEQVILDQDSSGPISFVRPVRSA